MGRARLRSEPERLSIVERAVELGSARAAAREAGIGESNVYVWAKEFGIKLTGKGGGPGRSKRSEEEKREIVDLAVRLGSVFKAAQVKGVGPSTICNWARQQGVQLTGKPGRSRSFSGLDRLLSEEERQAVEEHARIVDAAPEEIVRWAVVEYLGIEEEGAA